MEPEPQHEHNVALAFGLNILAGACTGIGAVAVALKYDISNAVAGGVLGLSGNKKWNR